MAAAAALTAAARSPRGAVPSGTGAARVVRRYTAYPTRQARTKITPFIGLILRVTEGPLAEAEGLSLRTRCLRA